MASKVQFETFMTMLGSLQMSVQQAGTSFNESLDEFFGLKDADEHTNLETVTDVGTGVKATQFGDGVDAIVGGINAIHLESLVTGKSLQTRSKPCMRLVGRQLQLGEPDETFHGSTMKRVICGVCHKNNQVPAQTFLMECGHCGARNQADGEKAIKVQCYKCKASNIADPDSKTIKCASCSEIMDVPDEDDE